MINARFFLDNKEVIGLWAIYAIAMWLGVCILDLIFDGIKARIQRKRRCKYIKQMRAEQKRKYIVDHKRFINQIRCSNQIRTIMAAEL